MTKKTIFLDFDGVLHGEGQNSKGLFEHNEDFCIAVCPFVSKTQIIISSSWRENYSLDQMKTLFVSDIAQVIVGVTPQRVDSYNKGGREKEILDYCNEHQISDWIAIDDMKFFFEDNCPQLLLTDADTGLTDKDLLKLQDFLKS